MSDLNYESEDANPRARQPQKSDPPETTASDDPLARLFAHHDEPETDSARAKAAPAPDLSTESDAPRERDESAAAAPLTSSEAPQPVEAQSESQPPVDWRKQLAEYTASLQTQKPPMPAEPATSGPAPAEPAQQPPAPLPSAPVETASDVLPVAQSSPVNVKGAEPEPAAPLRSAPLQTPQVQTPQVQTPQVQTPQVQQAPLQQALLQQQAQSLPTPAQTTVPTEAEAQRQVINLTSVSGAVPVAPMAQFPAQFPGQAAVVPGRMIRCRQCGRSASPELAICPHCGRDLKAAPSRWLTIGAPAVLALLLIALLALQGGRGPLGILGAPVRALNDWVTEMSASLDPQIAIIPSTDNMGAVALSEDFVPMDAPSGGVAPVGEGSFDDVSDAALVPGAADATVDPLLQASSESITATAEAEAAALVFPTEEAAAPSPEVPADEATPEIREDEAEAPPDAQANEGEASPEAEIALPTQTSVPTETPTTAPTDTPMPTDTPAPTNTPLPATYTVVAGDTALAIAMRLGVDLDELLAFNNMTAAQAAMLQPGQVLRIPGGVLSADSAAGETIYTVRQGDSLVVIAQRNNTTVAAIMAANGLGQNDVFALQPGQTLIIPGPTPAAAPAATDVPTATPEPTLAPTATLAPAAAATSAPATNALRVTAPRLRAPISGVSLRCSVDGRLQWNASPDILPDDQYRVHLGFVSGRDEGGNLKITWLVEQSLPSTTTQLPLDSTLCGTAPDGFGNQWRWYVDVVSDNGGVKLPVSTPSEVWGFAWN